MKVKRTSLTLLLISILIIAISCGGGDGDDPVSVIPELSVSDIFVSTTFHTATVFFKTNYPAQTQVLYDLSNDTLRNVVHDTLDFTKNHEVRISGLAENTEYYYQINAWTAGNELTTITDVATFTTPDSSDVPLGPVISNYLLSAITSSSVVVEWDTDVEADSRVFWGLQYNELEDSTSDLNFSSTHYMNLTDLQPNTQYYVRAASENSDGNRSYSEIKSFTTLEEQEAPEISDINITFVTGSSAGILWYTDREADSRVWYSTDSTSLTNLTYDDRYFVLEHYRGLGDYLIPDTVYYFKVMSITADNQISESDTLSFRTKPVLRVVCPDTLITIGSNDPYPIVDYPVYILDANDMALFDVTFNYDNEEMHISTVGEDITLGQWATNSDHLFFEDDRDPIQHTLSAAITWHIDYQGDIQLGSSADGDGDVVVLHFQTSGPQSGSVTDSIRIVSTNNRFRDVLNQPLEAELINGAITVVREE